MCRIPDEFSQFTFHYFLLLFLLFLWVNIVGGNARSWPPHDIFPKLIFYLFWFGLRNQPGVARRRSRSQFGLGSAPPPAPLRSLGKTRNSVCPRTANCSDVFFLPFPLHIHADTVDDTSFQICFTSPNLNCLFVFFCSGRFFGQSLGPFISVNQTVSAGGIECESSDLKNFNQDKKSQLARKLPWMLSKVPKPTGRKRLMKSQLPSRIYNTTIPIRESFFWNVFPIFQIVSLFMWLRPLILALFFCLPSFFSSLLSLPFSSSSCT